MRDEHRRSKTVDAGECLGTDGTKEQVKHMSTGTKTFLVAALMALVAISGSVGASNARAEVVAPIAGHAVE